MENYELEQEQAEAIKEARLTEYRVAIYERQLNAAMFEAQGNTERAAEEQAQISQLKLAIDALLALN